MIFSNSLRVTACACVLALAACGSGSPNSTSFDVKAVEDNLSALNSFPSPLDVMANDTHEHGAALQLHSFDATATNGGMLSRDDNGTPGDRTDDKIIYTAPSSTYTGTDSFTYSIQDSRGNSSAATVQVNVVNSNQNNPQPDPACAPGSDKPGGGTVTIGTDPYCFEGKMTTTEDGVALDFTVFVPSPAAFQALDDECSSTSAPENYGCVPLLIHSHGFGGAKHADFSQPGTLLDAQIANKMWKAGYFVITYTQRGFGPPRPPNENPGTIGLMAPDKEGEDFKDLLNWAVHHLRKDFIFDGTNDVVTAFDTGDTCHTDPIPDSSCPAWGDPLLVADNKNRVDPAASNGDQDVSVGTIGYSYGGGFQFNAQRVDSRVDAIMPMGTWHDLRYSLSSNDNPKSAWIELLTSFAISGGSNAPPAFLLDAGVEARGANNKAEDVPHNKPKQVSSVNANVIAPNGPVSYCQPGAEGTDQHIPGNSTPVNASLFMIQGYGDTLFNFNEGFDNAHCWEQAGGDVYLLQQTSGHPLPVAGPAHYAGSDTGMYLDEVVHCGYDTNATLKKPHRIQMANTGVAWFEWKLRQPAGADTAFVAMWDVDGTVGNHDRVCVTQENTDPNDTLADPEFNGTTSSATAFRYSKEGLMLSKPSDLVAPSAYTPFLNVTPPAQPILTGVANETFIPVHTVTATDQVLAGIPLVKLELIKPDLGVDQLIFLGTGIIRAGSTEVDLLHYQTASIRPYANASPSPTAAYPVDDPRGPNHVYPIRFGDHPQDNSWGRLIGVTARLNPGDVVGLVANGQHNMYIYNFTQGGSVLLSGPGSTAVPPTQTPIQVMLPLHNIGNAADPNLNPPCQQNDSARARFCP